MANLDKEQLLRLTRLGAIARLEQIRAEEEAIRQEFPELFGGTARGRRGRPRKVAAAAVAVKAVRRRRRPAMTPAQRKAVSERMRKYWAERRKAKGGK